MAIYAIIAAAGKGRRFKELKQFYPWRGQPLLFHTIDVFEQNKNIDCIIIVVPKNKIDATESLLKKHKYKKVHYVIPGGRRRRDSVYNGFKKIKRKQGIVVIHDGVRPIVSQHLLDKGIKLCHKYKAVIFGTPIMDTIKQIKGNLVLKTIPRNGVYLIQTPQFFDINLLKDAYKKIAFNTEYTDEASILESLDIRVHLFMGDQDNIKITQKRDLKLLARLLR